MVASGPGHKNVVPMFLRMPQFLRKLLLSTQALQQYCHLVSHIPLNLPNSSCPAWPVLLEQSVPFPKSLISARAASTERSGPLVQMPPERHQRRLTTICYIIKRSLLAAWRESGGCSKYLKVFFLPCNKCRFTSMAAATEAVPVPKGAEPP